MVCDIDDQRRAIILLVWARKTEKFYTNMETEENAEIFKYPGMITHISGKYRLGEPTREAMLREGYEESGFDFSGKIIIPKNQPLDFTDYHGWPVDFGYVLVEDEFEGKPIDKSVKPHRWMTRSELMDLSFEKREIRLEAQPALGAFHQALKDASTLG